MIHWLQSFTYCSIDDGPMSSCYLVGCGIGAVVGVAIVGSMLLLDRLR